MKAIVMIVGAADGTSRTPHDGRYLVAWNPHTPEGELNVATSPNKGYARVFDDVKDVLDTWQTVSNVQPTRGDGKPNRPLTAVHLSVQRAPEDHDTLN